MRSDRENQADKGEAAAIQLNTQELISRWSSQSAEQLAARVSEHLPFWVSLTLVIVIAYYLARLAWLIYPTADEVLWVPPESAPTGQPAARTGNTRQGYGAITDAHLFGSADEAAASAIDNETIEDAPDTRLNLSLRATIAASDATVAHAIIADGSGKEEVYFVSDPVPGGATLHRVETDRVILNRGGVMEALRLPREFGDTPARSTRNRSTATAPNIQRLITENANTFSEVIRPQPFLPNGQFKGYRLFPGRNRQQFIALGLRPGDLATEINGVALNDPSMGAEIFNSLGTVSQLSVTIERNGRPVVLTLDASQIVSSGRGRR